MRPKNTPRNSLPELRPLSSAETAQIIKDAQRMRAELLPSAGRGIARLGRALVAPLAASRPTQGGMKRT
jgi:hypothetical protein